MADPKLQSIRAEKRDAVLDIRAKLRELMAVNSDAMQERTISMRYDRLVIAVKTEQKLFFVVGPFMALVQLRVLHLLNRKAYEK